MAEKMDKRLPVTERTHDRVTRFKKTSGMSYDEVVNMLLDIAVDGDDETRVGADLAYAYRNGRKISRPRVTPDTGDDTEGDSRRRLIA